MSWRIHGNEHGGLEVGFRFSYANGRVRGKQVVVGIDKDDVIELGDTPVGSKFPAFYEMYRILLAEAPEIVPVVLLLVKLWVGWVHVGQLKTVRVGRGLALSIHDALISTRGQVLS